MNSESVVALSGWLKVCGHFYNETSKESLDEWTRVRFLVYKTVNQHFAIIDLLTDMVCADHNICFLNLKSCSVTVQPGVDWHRVKIQINTDLNNERLVLEIDAKSQKANDLNEYLKSDEQINKILDPIPRLRNICRQSSLERVDEDGESC